MQDFIKTVKQRFNHKYASITKEIPNEVLRRCKELSTKCKNIYQIFKENPESISTFIEFQKKFAIYRPEL